MLQLQTDTISFQVDLTTLLVWAFVGLVAGFLASRAMLGHGVGLLGDIVVGIVGAVIGGFLAKSFGIQVSVSGAPIVGQIIIAFVGALILLIILRLFGVGRRRSRALG